MKPLRPLRLADVRLSRGGRVIAAPAWAFEVAWALRGRLRPIVAVWRPLRRTLARRTQTAEAHAAARRQEDLAALTTLPKDDPRRQLAAIRVAARRHSSGPAHPQPPLNAAYPDIINTKRCVICQAEFVSLGRLVACSSACAARRRQATHRQSTRPRRRIHAPRPCAECGQTFTPQRTDARQCSVRCRVAAYRRRTRS
jgi:hypothetical protein